MIRQLPVIPTILVVAAAGVMVWLGFWQLGRAEEKAALIERYSQAQENVEPVSFPNNGSGEEFWFRRSAFDCENVGLQDPTAGTAANGAKGWAIRAMCFGGDVGVPIDLGFSRDLVEADWEGGRVEGIIAPGPRLVADPPLADLEPLAKPDPSDLPNNHLAYAGQWFFFAITALVIYFFAVRSKLKRRD